ncbi:GntR family transcriptional regulator [Aquincola sp. MAHUQ-54]|uniref:GntR family transcriptional regulator n=1 Tax=Aquincola agrisoli TaxID=3119538 RepID=A0AAW9QGQ2_9BURK
MALTALVTPVAKRQTLGADVHAQMRELLMSGQLMPGEQISLRSTAQALGVSVMPVREAMYQLVAEQALEITPNRAIRVPLMKVSRFREITLIRIHVEGLAVERAAQHASDALVAEMQGWNDRLEREMSLKKPDASKLITFNKELHFSAYRAAGMPTLLKMIESLWLRIGPILNYDLRGQSQRVAQRMPVIQHARMIEGMVRRDPAMAVEGLRLDIEGAAQHIVTSGVLVEADDE